jgi:arylsulfatase A-like enzyme
MPEYFDAACIWPREVRWIPESAKYTGQTKTDDPIWQPTATFWHPFIMRNGEFLETTDDDFSEDIFSDFIIDFVRENKDSGQPFLVYYPMVLPHSEGLGGTPYVATPDPANPGQRTEASYKAMKEYVDHIVGKIVRALDEEGVRNNTIVIFTGDNGSYGPHGKGSVYEPGVWVPFIVNYPGRIQARGMVDELVSHADVHISLAELAGAKVPEGLDGISFVPVLEGRKGNRDYVISFLGSERIIRDRRYLLEKNHHSFEGYFYDCGDTIAGQAGETSKTAYSDLTASADEDVLKEKHRLLKILEEFPVPDSIPLTWAERREKQREYDKSVGKY